MTAPAQFAAARLLRLAVSLRAGVAPDKADADAIVSAIERWQTERCSLDQAFGVKLAAGQLHPGTRTAIEQSRCHLRAGAAALAVPEAQRASALAKRFSGYAGRGWIRDRTAAECPRRLLGTVEEHLWRALSIWPRIVGERQIREILRVGSQTPQFISVDLGDDASNQTTDDRRKRA